MSNVKGANNKNKKMARPKRKKMADDRTPTVKKIDRVCKVIAIVLAIMFLGNLHVLVEGGGYDDTKIVPVFGFASSKVETGIMEPEIKAKSGIFTKVSGEYKEGDIVQYFDGQYNPVRRVIDVSEDGKTYTVVGDKEDKTDAVKVKASDISGKVFFDSKLLYGFLKIYATALGAALTVLLSFILLMMSDILMFKKRKAALQAKREAQAKKEARKLKAKQGMADGGDNTLDVTSDDSDMEIDLVDPVEQKRAEKQAKLDKEREEIAAEMKEIQKKMKAEEAELKNSGKRKRGKK